MKMNKSDDSDSVSQIDPNTKYIVLQNNHRRLLGVTTALTEALECTVRGEQLDLEETLNKCMKIYPELFTYNRKTRIKKISNNKLYNTSVSEDAGTDAGSFHIINELHNFHTPFQENITKSENKSNYHNNLLKIDALKSSMFIDSERENSEKSKSHSSIPKLNQNSSMNETGENTTSNFSDTSPFIILTPDQKQTSPQYNFNFTSNKNVNSNKRDSVTESVVDESIYTVKLPDSDTDLSNKCDNEKDQKEMPIISESMINEEKSNNNVNGNQNQFWPYEIIVQQTLSPRIDKPNDANLFIQIKPEQLNESNVNNNNINYTNLINNVQTQTIITRPLETCIIISKHVEVPKSNNNNNVHNIEEIVKDNVNQNNEIVKQDQEGMKNDTMDKLQKLSTGLKVQSNKMESKEEIQEMIVVPKKVVKESVAIQKVYPDGVRNEFCESLDCVPVKENGTNKYFVSLKEKLMTGSVRECSSILQMLRLTLIHTLAKERAAVMTSYVENDILNINKDNLLMNYLLPKEIVNGWDLILQQMVLKFLNTMCSIYKGRDYLTVNTKVMNSLINYFFQNYEAKNDSISQDMLMAVFHKLCTRQNQQAVLVNSGVVEKIFYSICEGHNTMSQYRLKHSLGVLINLCVFSSGRNVLEPMCSEMLTLLVSLLKKYDKKIIPYVARLIYVLMANEKFHKKAKEMDLLTLLEKTIDVSNKRLKLQLDVLKTVIDHPQPYEYLYGTEESFLSNIEAEMDELEEEVEIGEPSLTHANPDIVGKLKNNYQINDEKPIKQAKDVKRSNSPLKKVNKPRSIVNKKAIHNVNKSSLPKPIKMDTETEKMKAQTRALKKRSVPTIVSKPDKQLIKSKSFDKPKTVIKKQDSIKNADDSLTYVILKDTFNQKVEQSESSIRPKSGRKPLKYSVSAKNSDNSESSSENLNNTIVNNEKSDIKMDNDTSFVVLSENDSNKSMSIDLNMGSTSESLQSVEQVDLPSDILKTSEMLDNMDKNIQESNKFLLNNEGSHFVSLFIQHGKITEIEYDYCEDTKEIQSPIKYDNIFKENRSPYKSVLAESKKFNRDNRKLKNEISSDDNVQVDSKLETETSTENSELNNNK